MGQLRKAAENTGDEDTPTTVIAMIKNEPLAVPTQQLESWGENKDDYIKQMVINDLLAKEATTRNIVVSYEEAEAFMEEQRARQDSDMAELFEEYCRGAGISIEQYWQEAILAYQTMLIKNALYQRAWEEWLAENQDADQGSARSSFVENYHQQLMIDYVVVFVN